MSFHKIIFGLAALVALAGAATAQDQVASFSIGNDRFLAGNGPTHDQPGADDLFMAGEIVTMRAPITGSAHLAGRTIDLGAGVGGDAYIAGMDLIIGGDVAGDISIAGYDLTLDGAVGGDVRATGSQVALSAPVAGYAILSGDRVTLNGAVGGDVQIAARRVEFGPEARIDGTLTLYEQTPGEIEVPASVIDTDRVVRVEMSESDWRGADFPRVFSWRRMIWTFLRGVIVVALVAAAIAAVAPNRLADMRRKVLDAPFRSLWFGFLAQSTVLGAALVLLMTVIGIFVAPAALILALLGAFLGYVVAAYSIGVGLLIAIGRGEPDGLGARALAAGAGALIAGLIALIPLLGWLFVLAAVLAGVGAITTHLLRPRFFADPA